MHYLSAQIRAIIVLRLPTTSSLPSPPPLFETSHSVRSAIARESESPLVGSLILGTGKTVNATCGARGGDDRREWVAGLTGFKTAGDFHFVDPTDGQGKDRGHNDALERQPAFAGYAVPG